MLSVLLCARGKTIVKQDYYSPFTNLNGRAIQVWKWIRNFTPHIMREVQPDKLW